ncbi:MAG: Ppx/GppA family phosphatase [Anaerolineales bacterium]|nr:Ppx/GppA family phosphatase [Anaerolineales bacterium]
MVEHQPLHIAVIDLGSNTARLVVMHAIPGYSYRLQDEIREVVRLRQGMTEAGLGEAAEARGYSTLRLFKRFCESNGVHLVLPTATSAVREAANGKAFVERVARELGIALRVLTGQEEAYYGVLGVLNEVPIREGYVLDIGGGSAQLSEVCDGEFVQGEALTLGALALTERFIRHDPIRPAEFDAVRAEIERQLDTLPWAKPGAGLTLVGIGGTIRNLAAMEAARQAYPLNTLHGFSLSKASVEKSIQIFRELPLEKRQKLSGLHKDRADIILPGAVVVLAVMERLAVEAVTISISGLREGVFLEKFWRHLPYPVIPDVRRFSVLNMARNYGYQKNHANHVRFLALRIFDQLAPLHGYGPRERELLDAAAMLHDLGSIIGYEDHDKHSQTLIEFNGLAGYSPREIAIIALLTRYHRKGFPSLEGYKAVLDKQDKPLLERLAAILRLSEFLERGRNATVDDVTVTWNKDRLRITLIADEYPAVELWQAQRHALDLMAEAFKREIVLDSLAPPGDWSA